MKPANESDAEWEIAQTVVQCLLRDGFVVSVNDGGEFVLRDSRDADAILSKLRTTGEDYLHVTGDGTPPVKSWVRLIWGNGCDVIADHGVKLTGTLRRASELADQLDEQ